VETARDALLRRCGICLQPPHQGEGEAGRQVTRVVVTVVVETDKAGEAPMPFWSETVRPMVVE
jgi:hypothetical protein